MREAHGAAQRAAATIGRAAERHGGRAGVRAAQGALGAADVRAATICSVVAHLALGRARDVVSRGAEGVWRAAQLRGETVTMAATRAVPRIAAAAHAAAAAGEERMHARVHGE